MTTQQLNSENIVELVTAISKVQGEMMSAQKDSVNPFFKSKYADLTSVWNACREPLHKHGLCVIQAHTTIEGEIYLVTTLAHSTGQWMRSYYPICNKSREPQAVGAATTYARRFALAAMVGICTEDDDGESAMERNKKKNSVSDEEAEKLILEYFEKNFSLDSKSLCFEYKNLYCTHYKKKTIEFLEDHKDINKFRKDFDLWKTKHGKS